jgi:N-acetyl-gamma-glutamylphosphate reductase
MGDARHRIGAAFDAGADTLTLRRVSNGSGLGPAEASAVFAATPAEASAEAAAEAAACALEELELDLSAAVRVAVRCRQKPPLDLLLDLGRLVAPWPLIARR